MEINEANQFQQLVDRPIHLPDGGAYIIYNGMLNIHQRQYYAFLIPASFLNKINSFSQVSTLL